MSINFADVASRTASEIEKPSLPPVGHYNWRVTKLPTMSTSGDGKWDIVTFPLRALSACDDVEVDDYKGEITNIVQQHRFMFNKENEAEFDRTLFNLKTFILKHLKVGSEEDTVAQLLNASVNAEMMANIIWRADKQDPDIMHANIGRTAPVE